MRAASRGRTGIVGPGPGTAVQVAVALLLGVLACAPSAVRAGERPASGELLSSDAPRRRAALLRLVERARQPEALSPDVLPGLRHILQRDLAQERVLAAGLLPAVLGREAVDLWCACLDPVTEADERVWAAALTGLGSARAPAPLRRALLERARDPRQSECVRALALEALGGLAGPEADLLLLRPIGGPRVALPEPEPAPRLATDPPAAEPDVADEPWLLACARARGLRRMGRQPAVWQALLALLRASDLAVRVQAHESLVELSGQSLPLDAAVWEALLAAPLTLIAPAVPSAPAPDRYTPPTAPHVPHYYGLPIARVGSSVVFCLDVSQSMYGYGIDEARAELLRAIKDLPAGHAFEIVAFNERLLPWARRLVRAHPVQKARAIQWLMALEPTSYTNLYDAVDLAFGHAGRGRWPVEDPTALDAVFLLSDGAPNRGRHRTSEAVIRHIGLLADGRTPVHAIGAGEEVFPLLRAIAAATGGRFVDAFR